MPVNQTRDSIQDIWGPRTPFGGAGRWPVRVDERTIETPERWVQSCCILCSNGCGLDIGVRGGKIVGVRGRGVDHVNHGRLGPKGLHGWIANQSEERLTHPLIREDGKLREATWDEAMDLIVRKSRELIDQYTGKSIGIYGSGQLFIEEYHTIAMVAKAGIRTPHKDGNTRLCTATAEWALQETFGTDGQPSSYADIDATDAILLAGHNVASQQTVLWARILDRLAGPSPPKLVVIDPRVTETARHATVHLQPRVGTNLAVMNGLIHLVIRSGRIDREFIRDHTVGYDDLTRMVLAYPPEEVERISRVPAERLRAAADVLATAPRLFATVLQGFYQSHQATAASVQVNNLLLIRGMIGKPGCGVLQMNGQPTAENTRECGADGSYAVFYNFENPKHMEALARAYNVEPSWLPTYQPPTNVMQMIRYCELGSIKMFWIVATNPAVSLPELARIRRVLSKDDLFVIVEDAWLTETAELADVVLPAAIWGEKTGTFTNADRTVHISHKAIEPPGEARPDLQIWVDYARRMGFKNRDGRPLIPFEDAEGSFEHFKAMTEGRPCDYSGMSYARLTGGSGIRWPCNERHPNGAERLYTDHVFNTASEDCETWGHDLKSGAEVPEETYRASDPEGRAILRSADYTPPAEEPDDDYPLWLTTGRVVYHFHTRTKTARSEELNRAAPDAFVQLNAEDAQKYGIADGEMVEVESRRGKILAPARIGDILSGHIFIPFHYGDWDEPGRPRAANELTLSVWDPISKQPNFKFAAVKVRRASAVSAAAGLVKGAVELAKGAVGLVEGAVGTVRAGKKIDHYLGLLRAAEQELAEALGKIAARHELDSEVAEGCKKFANWATHRVAALQPFIDRYRAEDEDEPTKLRRALFQGPRVGGLGLMRDIQDLWLLAQEAQICWLALKQAGRALEDTDLESACDQNGREENLVVAWCRTQFKSHIAQALLMG